MSLKSDKCGTLLTYLNSGNASKTRVLDTKRVLQFSHKVLTGYATQLKYLLRRLVTKCSTNIKFRPLQFYNIKAIAAFLLEYKLHQKLELLPLVKLV